MPKVFKNPGPLSFTGVITDAGGNNHFIPFPYDLKETYGVGNLVPFKATFDGRVEYRGSLAKMGRPEAMVMLRSDVFADIGKQAGDTVEVVVELDDKPREVIVPEDAKAALKSADLLEYFEGLAYTHRKEYVRWVEEAKKPETRANRIQKMCEMLAAGQTHT
ncbi:MAG TPA: YdeI/OmpD-associated family protein [Candidatus Saccharimonadales bacterium]|nr:YdeI/OmpD-associated family protein [Candidatus Saccharimonadales bacterium]